MDQPTSINITIKGSEEDVKRAALAAQRRIDSEHKESEYEYGDGSNFEAILEETLGVYGDYSYNDNGDGTAEYTVTQDSYSCIEETDIREIANDIIDVASDVEFSIRAVITITYSEGYDLCVDIDYEGGELRVDVSEEEYEDWDDDEDDEDDE